MRSTTWRARYWQVGGVGEFPAQVAHMLVEQAVLAPGVVRSSAKKASTNLFG